MQAATWDLLKKRAGPAGPRIIYLAPAESALLDTAGWLVPVLNNKGTFELAGDTRR